MVTIIRETSEHVEAINRLTVAAFAASDLGYNGEADLIDAIRDQCEDPISLVAIEDSVVVGHILFSPSTIITASRTIYGLGLAPMSVLPSHQGLGIGSFLVREGVRQIAESDSSFILVAGHPEFYSRFGFLPAQRYSITHGFTDMPQDILFIHLLDESLEANLTNGLAYYHSTFGPQHRA